MKIKESSLIFLLFLFVSAVFFYKFFLHGFLPIPGDLLISTYNPWRSYSFLGYAPGGFPTKDQYFDVIRQMYPWRDLAVQLIKSTSMPLWNPYNFSGAPLLANFQSAVFYPFNVLFFILPFKISWSILVFLQPLFGAYATYLFLRSLKLGKTASFFGAISYGFSLFQTVWLEYNTVGQIMLWLPVSLFATEKIFTKKKPFWIFVFVFSLIATLFAGHPQMAFYSFVFIAAYIFCRVFSVTEKKKIQELAFFMLLMLIAVGIAAIQLLPGLELMGYASRSAHDYGFFFNKLLIQPWQLIMFFIPDFFGNPATRSYWIQDTYVGKVSSVGIMSVPFLLLAIRQWKNSEIKFFVIVATIILVLACANPMTAVLYKLPSLLSSSPTLAVYIFSFCVCVLASFGVEFFMKEKIHVLYAVSPVLIIFLLLWISVLAGKNTFFASNLGHATIALHSLYIPSAIFFLGIITIYISVIRQKFKAYAGIFFILLQAIFLFYYFQKFNPFVPKEIVYPNTTIISYLENHQGIYRHWGFGAASIEANFATEEHIYSPEGYDPLYPRWYGEFIQSSVNGTLPDVFSDKTRSDALIAPSSSEEFPVNASRQKVLDLLGVKYILDKQENASSEKTFPPNKFTLAYQDNGWEVFTNKNVLPRAFLVTDIQGYSSANDFAKKFFEQNFDPKSVVFLENKVLLPTLDKNATGNVSIESYLPNKIRLAVRSSGKMLLFLSDTYYPGWQAFIDGHETQVYKADYAFRAVIVPTGLHTVEYVYNPGSFAIGLKVSIIALLALVILLLIVKKNKYEK